MKKTINMLLETQSPWEAAANLAVYSLSIDTYIISETNTDKENKFRKLGIFYQTPENVHDISLF